MIPVVAQLTQFLPLLNWENLSIDGKIWCQFLDRQYPCLSTNTHILCIPSDISDCNWLVKTDHVTFEPLPSTSSSSSSSSDCACHTRVCITSICSFSFWRFSVAYLACEKEQNKTQEIWKLTSLWGRLIKNKIKKPTRPLNVFKFYRPIQIQER